MPLIQLLFISNLLLLPLILPLKVLRLIPKNTLEHRALHFFVRVVIELGLSLQLVDLVIPLDLKSSTIFSEV